MSVLPITFALLLESKERFPREDLGLLLALTTAFLLPNLLSSINFLDLDSSRSVTSCVTLELVLAVLLFKEF